MPKKTRNIIETEFRADDKFSRHIGRMSRGLAFMSRAADRAKRALLATGRGLLTVGRAGARLARVGFYAVAGAATAVFLSVTKLASGMDELAKTTRAIDFPIEQFQEYSFAAQQSGVDSESFTKSLKKFTKTVGETKGGYGAMFTALKKTNPQLLKQIKNTENVADAFDLYLTAIRNTPNATKKAALATAGFGRDGLSMVNMANLSAESLAGLRAEMRENGVVTQEQAAKAEVFNDMLNRMKLTIKGVAVEALTPLMPLLTKAMNATRKWIVANKGLIRQKIEQTFTNIVKYGKIAIGFIQTNVPPLIDKIKEIGSKGFAWIKDNKKEIADFGTAINTIGGYLLSVVGFALKHKAAILALVVAYKALSISMGLLNFAGMASGAASATVATGTLMTKIQGFSGMVGKGGLLVTALAAGWAVGSVIFENWNKSASNMALNFENAAARVSLAFKKMNDQQLVAADKDLAAKEKKLTSTWESVKAFVTGNFAEHQSAIKAVKDARIKGLSEQVSRISSDNKIVNDYNRMGYVAGRQSGGVGDSPSLNPVESSAQAANEYAPSVQVQRMESMKTEKTEIVIKDETGRAEVTRGKSSNGLTLLKSGAM